MRFSTLLTSSLAALASATNHDIVVGKNGLTFEPNTTTAAKGDTLTFHFWPKAHSVVQGPLDSPCTASDGGFNSYFVATASGAANRTFVVTVNDTKPIWFYCSQGDHCESGMVGAVNPTSDAALAKYAAGAAKVSKVDAPTAISGGVFKAVDSSSSSGSSSSSSSSSGSASSSSTPATTPPSSSGAAATLGQGLGFAAAVAVLAGVWGL